MILAANESRLHAPARTIETGPWRLQLRGDELADIEFRGHQVLRAIRPVVRDHDWRTLAPTVESMTTDDDGGTFSLRFTVAFAGFGAEYRAELTVSASDDELTVAFDGTAPGDFRSNRIGLVVLHRPDDAGRSVTVTAPDQTRTGGAFPTDISPHQPFLNIAAMSWERDGTAFGLEFTGDTFETEDQRNWTDASFKTYSTPLSRPFPVAVHAGDRVHQSIRLTAAPAQPAAADMWQKPLPRTRTRRADHPAPGPGPGSRPGNVVIAVHSQAPGSARRGRADRRGSGQ